jgi:trans-2,3-dihydro-3-hydroxyanthranilate isomerase
MNDHRRFTFVQWDVFSARPLEGNPLAVFVDARGLSDAEMQALAREMNLAETTFVFPGDGAPQPSTSVRIFTVSEELPFAGHPTLGTAFVLRGDSGAGEVTLDLRVGKIPVRFEDRPGEPTYGEMRQRDPEFGPVHPREDIARALGWKLDDIDPQLPVQTVSTGLPFTIVPLPSLAAARRLEFNYQRAAAYLERTGGKFFYFVCRETVDRKARLHARMIFYNGEDPATGSAAGCACAWMVAHGLAKPGEQALIEQGIEAGRPSRIFVRGERNADGMKVHVGGNAVPILAGEVRL